MRRVGRVLPAGSWALIERLATVTLPWSERHRRRMRLDDDAGSPFLLDLERPTVLADGDGLLVDGGGVIAVVAAAEPVIEVKPGSAAEAARFAWHLGNRHAPVQILAGGGLRLLDDPILAAMLRGLGAVVVQRQAAFVPEAGAYALADAQAGGHGGH
ncbi:MAG: urease accessory protein UreE [Rhodospirillales bacterium]|nr:urease accessory protein UreE [Rhodospirillales bacterium]